MDLEGCKADQLVDIQIKLSLIQLKDSDKLFGHHFINSVVLGLGKKSGVKGNLSLGAS